MFLIFYEVINLSNKVFDFKINQKLCFLVINHNGNVNPTFDKDQ